MEKGRVLLNIMYTGKYISEYNKIGHEIINLFKADDGNNYIYITPYGTVNEEVNDEIVFSNLLAYYLSEYSKIFISFANEILELDNIEHIEYFDVQREK